MIARYSAVTSENLVKLTETKLWAPLAVSCTPSFTFFHCKMLYMLVFIWQKMVTSTSEAVREYHYMKFLHVFQHAR